MGCFCHHPLSSLWWRRRPSILHGRLSSFAVKISGLWSFCVSPTSPIYHQQHSVWSSRTGEWFGLPRSRHVQLGPFMSALVSSVDLAGLAGRKGKTLCFFGIACVCEHFFCWAWQQNQSTRVVPKKPLWR